MVFLTQNQEKNLIFEWKNYISFISKTKIFDF